MATREFKWRKTPSGTEGTSTVYVHSDTGSDLFGDGTRANPYQTLGRAYRGGGTKPSRIIGVGRFSEMMADGNHSCVIEGDYYGAMVFDGAGYYVLYGFRHNDLIITNTGIGEYDLVVHTGSVLYAGVGSAYNAHYVGNAGIVCGVAGSSCLIDNSSHYWGVLGGTTAVKYVGFSRPKAGYYPISLGSNGGAVTHDTFYGCRIANRQRKVTSKFECASSIFADFDMFADDAATFTQVLFGSDCEWYYKDLLETDTPQFRIIVDTLSVSETVVFTADTVNGTMTIGGGGVTDIPSAIGALYTAGRITSKPTFVTCIFSTQTASQIFNNPTKQDFTLKAGSDAIVSDYAHYGAFPPCLNVPIMSDSSGVAGTWDENTCDGLINVSQDNEICIDETSLATEGSILSKIVQVNPATTMIAGIYSAYASKFADYGCALWSPSILHSETYSAGDELPVGRYLVHGAIVYDGQNFENRSVIVVSQENTTFTDDNVVSTLLQLKDANISNVVYIRTLPAIYRKIKASEGLQRGATYLNCGESNITYRTRTIVPGESFVAENSTDSFIGNDADCEIAVMFDDTRVPYAEWLPAQLFGEFFVVKESGTVRLDDYDVPISSGNYLAWQSTANGGYSASRRNSIKQRYFQFKLAIQCVYDSIN